MNVSKFDNPKVLSVVAIVGSIFNFVASIIFTIKDNRETTALIALVAAFYCLTKVNFKRVDKDSLTYEVVK